MPTPLVTALVLLWLTVAGTVLGLLAIGPVLSVLEVEVTPGTPLHQMLRADQVWSVIWLVMTVPLLLLVQTRRPAVRRLLLGTQTIAALVFAGELAVLVATDVLSQVTAYAEIPPGVGLSTTLTVLVDLVLRFAVPVALLHRATAEYFHTRPTPTGSTEGEPHEP